jgi:hypothetical protein
MEQKQKRDRSKGSIMVASYDLWGGNWSSVGLVGNLSCSEILGNVVFVLSQENSTLAINFKCFDYSHDYSL